MSATNRSGHAHALGVMSPIWPLITGARMAAALPYRSLF